MGVLDKLSKLIVGSDTKDLEEVRKSLSRLKTLKSTTELVSFSSLVSSLQDQLSLSSKNNSNKDLYTSFKDGLKDLGLDAATLSIESDRQGRYKEYEAIVKKIPYMKRALKVLTQNVLNPEDYTKDPILIHNTDEKLSSEIVGKYERNISDLLNYLELQEFCYDIVYNTLKYGDYFAEIIILPEVLKRYKLLSESHYFKENLTFTINNKRKVNVTIDFDLNSLQLMESTSKPRSNNTLEKLRQKSLSQNDIYLNFLSPEYVVRLGDRFCIGYIVFKNVTSEQSLSGVNTTVERLANQDSIKVIVKKLMTQISRNTNKVQDLIKTETDLKYTLARFLATYIGEETSTSDANLQIRFVPPELMEHFTISKSEFKPYGTSIFYGTEFLSKVLIAIQTSIMLSRLNKAIERRIIRVDLGASRDARKYLMEVKRLMNRRRYTVDNMGTVDEVPSNLTTFEDIYIPVKDGRSPVEFDTLSGIGDIPTQVEDLKTIRDSLVSSVEVPPPYIGIEENTESKAQLTQENVVFATTVRNYQTRFSTILTSLLHKVLTLITKDNNELDELKKFVLTFEPPVSIAMEHKSEYLQNVANVIETLTNLGLPKEYLIRKFIPQFKTWESESAQIIEKLEKVYRKSQNEGEEEGGFGGGAEFGGGGETGGF